LACASSKQIFKQKNKRRSQLFSATDLDGKNEPVLEAILTAQL
jgi:hypothetical protein